MKFFRSFHFSFPMASKSNLARWTAVPYKIGTRCGTFLLVVFRTKKNLLRVIVCGQAGCKIFADAFSLPVWFWRVCGRQFELSEIRTRFALLIFDNLVNN